MSYLSKLAGDESMARGRNHYQAMITLLSLAALSLCQASAASNDIALLNGKIYPSPHSAPIENGRVLIRNGRIVSVGRFVRVPPHTPVLDCAGMVITAGFWNSHVHILTPGLLNASKLTAAHLNHELEQMLTRWGFTTVFDIASVLENTKTVRRRILSNEVRGPNILTVGEPFYPKNGTPVYVANFLKTYHISLPETTTTSEAVSRAKKQLRNGADGIKLFTGTITANGVLPMRLDMARAVVLVAHQRGRPVFAHPSNLEGMNVAIDSGVDVLAHTAPLAGPWTGEHYKKDETAPHGVDSDAKPIWG